MILRLGDSQEVLKDFKNNHFDSCVTDPPYGLKFMGKKWDYDVPTVSLWKEVYRVLKPGAYLLSFGGTRTYHRMVVNIEDAGFEIRDQIQWLYGSGFPKSMNISKALDKKAGVERKDLGPNPNRKGRHQDIRSGSLHAGNIKKVNVEDLDRVTEPATEEAKQWNGWGTALKPAHEPIVLARKPPSEKTVAENVLKWGTGGLNIDGCRIKTDDNLNGGAYTKGRNPRAMNPDGINQRNVSECGEYSQPQGRFPANLLLDEQAAEMLDKQSGVLKTGAGVRRNNPSKNVCMSGDNLGHVSRATGDNVGGASRFFYVAKASKSERGEANNHPTVKPIKLIQYLIRLVTPPKGIVLDPFMGSGTNGIAALLGNMDYCGIEINPEYFEIAKARIDANKS